MTASTEHSERSTGDAAYSADGLVAVEPITDADTLRDVLESGHPILRTVELPNWANIFTTATHTGVNTGDATTADPTTDGATTGGVTTGGVPVGGSVSAQVERFATHAVAVDQFRALELVYLATAVLSLAFTQTDSSKRLTKLFTHPTPSTTPADTSTSSTPPENPQASSAFSATPLVTDDSPAAPGMEAFCTHAEYLLTTAEETAIVARVNSRTGNTRKQIGQAVTAYVGTPLLLRAVLEGRLRFNRWEHLIRKYAWLPLRYLRVLDVFIAGLDPRYSLNQFMLRVGEFLARIVEKPVLAAKVRQGRGTWVEDLPDGESIGCLKGPTPLIHAWHNKGRMASHAVLKGQLESVEVTPLDTTVTTSAETDAEVPTGDTSTQETAAQNEHTAQEESTAPVGTTAQGQTTVMSSTDELPPMKSMAVRDEREIQQLMFDVLINATPTTQTTLETIETTTDTSTGMGAGTTTQYRVDIACPDEGTVLRKHAAVVVTVPMTTLLGVDERPGMIGGTPVPADMARMIASKATVWYRMLTDPTTGRVLDEVALKYEPDRATRIAVQGKWQTCTAPGCSRPAVSSEIDHGVPFNHSHPNQGGRTEPANLHPLCKRHHQAKTQGTLRMRRTTADEIQWLMPLGTTSTTVAPCVDDGGVLSAAGAPADSPERVEARRLLADRLVVDPVTGLTAADAVFAAAWEEYRVRQEAWDRSLERGALARMSVAEEKKRFKVWASQQREALTAEKKQVEKKGLDIARRAERVSRDERLVALQRAKLEQREHDVARATTVHADSACTDDARGDAVHADAARGDGAAGGGGGERAQPLRSRSSGSSVVWKTIIPMRVETFDAGRGKTCELYRPLFPPPPPFREPHTDQSSDGRASEKSDENAVRGPAYMKALPPGASLAADLLASAVDEYEATRAGYVVLRFDEVALLDPAKRLDRTKLRRCLGLATDSADSVLPEGATEDSSGPDLSGADLSRPDLSEPDLSEPALDDDSSPDPDDNPGPDSDTPPPF